MIYTVIRIDDHDTAYLLNDIEEYFELSYDPEVVIFFALELGELKGDTDQEKRNDLETKAINYSNNREGGLSWYEESLISDYFRENAEKYGLTEVFEENCII